MKEFRFSDDGGCSLLNIVNYAPLLCVPQHNPYDSNVLCATPEPGPLPTNITWGQSSIIVEGGYLCGIPIAILLEQIPNQLVLRDTVNLPGTPRHEPCLIVSCNWQHSVLLNSSVCLVLGSVGRKIVAMGDDLQDLSSSGPNGAMMQMAAKTPQALRYVFSDIWNGVPSTAGLPVELWPYVSAHRVYASGPPSAGLWKKGQIVWQEVHRPSLWANGSVRVATYPEYEPFQEWEEQALGTPMGWVCSKGGEPGQWLNMSSIGPDGSEEEKVVLQEEVAELRKVVEALVVRVAALEAKPS
jgi:hypothetical protein